MTARKRLETMSGMILNQLQPKFEAKSVANEMQPVLGQRVSTVSSDLNRTVQWLQMAARKSFETMSGMILNWFQPKFAAKSVAKEMQYLKAIWWWGVANEMQPVLGQRVSSDLNRTVQWFQMAARKSFETMSGMILNRIQPKFEISQIGSKWNAIFEGHLVTSVDRMSVNFQFEDFLSNLSL